MAVTATLECGCRRSLPPLHRSAKLGWRACCGFASVHRLPRPRGYIPAHVETRTVSSGSPPFQLKSCVLRRGRACRAAHSVGQEWAGSAFSWIENPTVSCVQGYSGCPVLKKNTSCWVARPVPLGTTRPRRETRQIRPILRETVPVPVRIVATFWTRRQAPRRHRWVKGRLVGAAGATRQYLLVLGVNPW
jgi:hypothetical protein